MKFTDGSNPTLDALTALSSREQSNPTVRELATQLTAPYLHRSSAMDLIIDELQRRFVYVADPLHGETIGPMPPFAGQFQGDVEEACLFVMTLAQSVGIPCRFVMARYGRAWTLFVAYEREGGGWAITSPLRQKHVKVKDADELIMGPIPKEASP